MNPSQQGAVVRRRVLSALAKARAADVTRAWDETGDKPAYETLRGPQTGLVMVRGRAGGTGESFNLGEMTVTRASVRLEGGQVGHGYVAGRDKDHALGCALFDALVQVPGRQGEVLVRVVEPLERAVAKRSDRESARIDATRVEFFTMVRGDD
ncbi:phosphonate C-P lyase system protein PhnG [Fundidesulfovibrio butyratiphilus]